MPKKTINRLSKLRTEKHFSQQAVALIPPREGYFDEFSIKLLDTFSLDEGVLIFIGLKKRAP